MPCGDKLNELDTVVVFLNASFLILSWVQDDLKC